MCYLRVSISACLFLATGGKAGRSSLRTGRLSGAQVDRLMRHSGVSVQYPPFQRENPVSEPRCTWGSARPARFAQERCRTQLAYPLLIPVGPPDFCRFARRFPRGRCRPVLFDWIGLQVGGGGGSWRSKCFGCRGFHSFTLFNCPDLVQLSIDGLDGRRRGRSA